MRMSCYNSLGKYQIQGGKKRTAYTKDKLP